MQLSDDDGAMSGVMADKHFVGLYGAQLLNRITRMPVDVM